MPITYLIIIITFQFSFFISLQESLLHLWPLGEYIILHPISVWTKWVREREWLPVDIVTEWRRRTDSDTYAKTFTFIQNSSENTTSRLSQESMRTWRFCVILHIYDVCFILSIARNDCQRTEEIQQVPFAAISISFGLNVAASSLCSFLNVFQVQTHLYSEADGISRATKLNYSKMEMISFFVFVDFMGFFVHDALSLPLCWVSAATMTSALTHENREQWQR